MSLDLLLHDDTAHAIARRAHAAGATVHACSRSVLDAASPVRSPSGVVALARWSATSITASLTSDAALALGLCDVQDPGNVGAAIRAADALGATGVLALDGTADPHGWKVQRGAMGSTFHLPVARGSADAAMTEARRLGLRVVATVARGGVSLEAADLRSPMLLLVGGEGAGLARNLTATADVCVTIPMRAGVDSLNVSVTAAIVLFEARRQRRAA